MSEAHMNGDLTTEPVARRDARDAIECVYREDHSAGTTTIYHPDNTRTAWITSDAYVTLQGDYR